MDPHDHELLSQGGDAGCTLRDVGPVEAVNTVGSQNSLLFHGQYRDPELVVDLLAAFKVTNCPVFVDLEPWRATKESRLVHGPDTDLIQRLADIQTPVLADVAVVEGAVAELVLVGHETIQILDRMAKFVAYNHLAFPLLGLFDQI